MSSFKVLLEMADIQEQKEKLLHMMIDKITINPERELESIEIKINDDVVNYIARSEEVSNKDASFFICDKIYGVGDCIENYGIIYNYVKIGGCYDFIL